MPDTAPPLPRPVRLLLWVLTAGVAVIAWTGLRIADGTRYHVTATPTGEVIVFDAWRREACSVAACVALAPEGQRPRLLSGADSALLYRGTR